MFLSFSSNLALAASAKSSRFVFILRRDGGGGALSLPMASSTFWSREEEAVGAGFTCFRPSGNGL